MKKGVLHFFYITKPFNTARISPNFTHLVIASTLHIAIIRLQKSKSKQSSPCSLSQTETGVCVVLVFRDTISKRHSLPANDKTGQEQIPGTAWSLSGLSLSPRTKVLDYTYSNKAAILLALHFITFSSPYLI